MEQGDIKKLKGEARARAGETVAALGRGRRLKASGRICRTLIEYIKTENIGRIFCYFGLEPEVLTGELMNFCLETGRELYLPVCVEGRTLEFYRVSDLNLRGGILGIPAPAREGSPEVSRKGDLVIVPGVAFAKNGTRLGRGAGYYDRFLASSGGLRVGVCFDCVLFDSLPHDMYDIAMDLLVTEKGVKSPDVS